MRLLVLGGGGMLGHRAFQRLSEEFETFATFRQFSGRLRATGVFTEDRVIPGVHAEAFDTVVSAIERVRPAVVVNCIGIVKQLPEAKDHRLSIYTNALFPHLLAHACAQASIRVIHISTDCVFSGRTGMYSDGGVSDAEDLYGRTKYLGEVDAEGMLTIRTSIIGRELFSSHSLVDWFLGQQGGAVQGYRQVIFSGLSTIALSDELARIIREKPALSGVYNVSSDPISKFDLLGLLRDNFHCDVAIAATDDVRCDRSLDSTRYRKVAGFEPTPWPKMVREMAADAFPYARIKQLR